MSSSWCTSCSRIASPKIHKWNSHGKGIPSASHDFGFSMIGIHSPQSHDDSDDMNIRRQNILRHATSGRLKMDSFGEGPWHAAESMKVEMTCASKSLVPDVMFFCSPEPVFPKENTKKRWIQVDTSPVPLLGFQFLMFQPTASGLRPSESQERI